MLKKTEGKRRCEDVYECDKYFCSGLHGGGGLVTKSCPTVVTPWTRARQAFLSIGFSRQEYWSVMNQALCTWCSSRFKNETKTESSFHSGKGDT